MPYEQHIAKQMANKPLLFSRCLLRTQKLSESRCEGEIIEPTDEGTLKFVEHVQHVFSSTGSVKRQLVQVSKYML